MMSSRDFTSYTRMLLNASRIKAAIPSLSFTIPMALRCAGMDVQLISEPSIVGQVEFHLQHTREEIIAGSLICNMKERAKILVCFATCVPALSANQPIHSQFNAETMKVNNRITDMCRWVGFPEEELKANSSRKHYIDVFHYSKKLKKGEASVIHQTSVTQIIPLRIPKINQSMPLSPMTADSTSPTSSLSTTDSSSSSSISATSQQSRNSNSLASHKPSSKTSSIFSNLLVASKEKRMTVEQKQDSRRDQESWELCYRTAFKVATVLFNEVKGKRFPLTKYQSPDDVADFVNQGFGCDFVTGREISEGVKKGLIGKDPPKRGRKPVIDDDDLDDLAFLVFTCQTIEQANGDPNRLGRIELASLIQTVVDEKRNAEGLDGIHGVTFFERIQKKNSTSCELASTADKRELLRTLWLTFDQQEKHYKNWENFVVEKGFARLPFDNDEREREGYVVFYSEQLSRITHIDEMGFSFDGSKNGVGGRPEATFDNPEITSGGLPIQKSSLKVSILFGSTYDHQILPPLIVIPTRAKNPSISVSILQRLHQIQGKFGYPRGLIYYLLVSAVSKPSDSFLYFSSIQ